MDAFGLTLAQIDAAGAHWTVREVLQQPHLWAQIERELAADAARLAAFLGPAVQTT